MRLMILVLAGAVGLMGCGGPRAGGEPELLFTVVGRTEGIVFDRDGNGYISHGPDITRFTPGGEHRVWLTTGAPNGHKILPDGTHLVCDDSRGQVLHIAPDGKLLPPAAAECDGKKLRGPNDLTLDGRGGFYFTDPGGSDKDHPTGTVHHVDAAGKVCLVAQGLQYPNGILLLPGGKTLLVAESMTRRILRYNLDSPGKAGPPTVFAVCPAADKTAGQVEDLPDGMSRDSHGNIYVAQWGMRQVQVFDPRGNLIARLPGGNLMTTNVAFRPGSNDLYLTGGLDPSIKQGGLYRLKMNVHGARAAD
jgi:gluconolactonase